MSGAVAAPETECVELSAMSGPSYVAVDWGTSSFRLWLMDAGGEVFGERRSDQGMTAAARTGFAPCCNRISTRWGRPSICRS